MFWRKIDPDKKRTAQRYRDTYTNQLGLYIQKQFVGWVFLDDVTIKRRGVLLTLRAAPDRSSNLLGKQTIRLALNWEHVNSRDELLQGGPLTNWRLYFDADLKKRVEAATQDRSGDDLNRALYDSIIAWEREHEPDV